jgi:hypothetical protein
MGARTVPLGEIGILAPTLAAIGIRARGTDRYRVQYWRGPHRPWRSGLSVRSGSSEDLQTIYIIGFMTDQTGTYAAGTYLIGLLTAVGFLLRRIETCVFPVDLISHEMRAKVHVASDIVN